MVTRFANSFLRAAPNWRPGEAVLAAWYRLHDWLMPRPEPAFLAGEKLEFVAASDVTAPTTEVVPTASTLAVLELPMDGVLTQSLLLPERIRRCLDQAIEHNLQQWSPFSADDVMVAYRTGPRSGTTFKLDLRYVVRSHVEPILAGLRTQGISPVAVALGDRDWLSVIDRAALETRVRQRRRVRLLSLTAAILLLCLWLAAGWRQERQLQQIQQSRYQTIAQLRQVSDEVAQLRKIKDARRLVAEAAGSTVGNATVLLAATLPDSVAPISMTVERGSLRLIVPAVSAETARAALAGSADFENPIVERIDQNHATISVTRALGKAR